MSALDCLPALAAINSFQVAGESMLLLLLLLAGGWCGAYSDRLGVSSHAAHGWDGGLAGEEAARRCKWMRMVGWL